MKVDASIPSLLAAARAARALSILAVLPGALVAQDDFSVLRINEVIADNATRPPADKTGAFQDMVEIYNTGDVRLSLSTLAVSDTPDAVPPNDANVLQIPSGTTIEPRGFVVLFFSGKRDVAGDCQTDINLGLAKDGSEPVTLWGPKDGTGKRAIIDQVYLPPLEEDVSFGRLPDGAGPAPVPVEETYTHFKFFPPAATTFGTCGTGACSAFEAPCKGAPNGSPGNIAPRVNRATHSTNHPLAGEAVLFTARVEDDKDPTPGNIKSVKIQYSVNGSPQPDLELAYDDTLGIQTGAAEGKPLKRWTTWQGSVPGQDAGALVQLTIVVEDQEGLTGRDPKTLCDTGVGPCDDLGLPGPNCVPEPLPSLQFVACETPFRYVSGYSPQGALASLVINEVMAVQTKTFPDGTQFDDYIELFNGSAEVIDLSGLWLSDKPFQPQGWQFPAGSRIDPGQYLVVWTDADGGQCPRPPHKSGDGQKCPDPTDPTRGAYHTNFALELQGDQVYLFDRADRSHGVIHGVEFGLQTADVALELLPDGARSGAFEPRPGGSPGAPSSGVTEAKFRRGDANTDCGTNLADAVFVLRFLFQGGDTPLCPDAADVDDSGQVQITDAVFLLNYLFQGGPNIPPPGDSTAGDDPTADDLGPCGASSCT